MKSFYFILIVLLVSHTLHAQADDPISWSFHAEKSGNKIYIVHLSATIQPGWHIYAQQQPKDAIAQPTKIDMSNNPLVLIKDKWKEAGKKEIQDLKTLDIAQFYYTGSVDFEQSVQLKANVQTNLTGAITYMACTDKMCLPVRTIRFNISLGK
ncbi:MAG: hypothetical protein EPN39_00220 [Chitinophagaceae bacterium]|nr:MAG: hypothetical protein EPN39_00220 [Chitinophagaceae bacterium]